MARRKTKMRAPAVPAAHPFALVPMVMFMRLPLLAAEAMQSGLAGRETARAVTEKAGAIAEGIAAAQIAGLRAAAQFWPEVISGRTPSIFTGAAARRSLEAALAPAGRRVRANYRRLGKPG